jgi:glycosyltransferase involved in cell wall biosynthesis
VARLVLAGGDQGNRSHVEALADSLGVRDQVVLTGFVPGEEMQALYRGCAAVVMPSYFGPTNIPPLEAWLAGRPLIYSSTFKDQAGDAALCIDPDSAEELAGAMQASLQPEVRDRLVRAGALRLKEVETQRGAAEAKLLGLLERFAARRRCWA